ncbi:MAG TPA: ATP-binding protein [Patescibacteria group bacterium]|nr:ATP-binding protein [Patescibacteria group bacterium]
MNLSLRHRLTIWYGTIVALTLLVFGMVSYISVSTELRQNLDASLERVGHSLNYIIGKNRQASRKPLRPAQTERRGRQDEFAFLRDNQKQLFYGPIRPVDSAAVAERDVVWTAVYEHILLNSKNFYIQVADTNNQIVFRSENLLNANDSLPTISQPSYLAFEKVDGALHGFAPYVFKKQNLRLMLMRTKNAQISIGYPVDEIEATLGGLFGTLLVAYPFILIISLIGGHFLAKQSLQPIDDITQIARDITASNLSRRLPPPPVNDDEIARLTATLNQMIERLEASFAQIRQFTADASHELRTPLAILMGEIEIALRSRKKPEEYERVLNSSLEEVHRLSNVVSSLLELSKAESGQVKMADEDVDLSLLVADICEDMEILAAEKNIKLHCDILREVKICGDNQRLHQVFLNVIENAVKYTLPGGEVFVRVFKNSSEAIITVRDTGVGIPQEDVPYIFDRFYRVDKSRTSMNIPGNGLGLSIVKWIVEAHDGIISVESKSGEGSTFTIQFPLKA